MLTTARLEGVRGYPLSVNRAICGLSETALRESIIRVRAALETIPVEVSDVRAQIMKVHEISVKQDRYAGGYSAFDLAIAMKLAGIDFNGLVVGELALNGNVRPVRGIVPMLIEAKKRGYTRALIPASQVAEAQVVKDIRLVPAESFEDVYLRRDAVLPMAEQVPSYLGPVLGDLPPTLLDAFTKAVRAVKKGKHVLLVGRAGSGKTMIARRIVLALDPLTEEETLEVLAIRSAAGLLGRIRPGGERPFRAPHHTASTTALTGGGRPVRPGEMTLAHRGVLFLDELPEFLNSALLLMAGVRRVGEIRVGRYHEDSVVMPTECAIVAAMNTCPCVKLWDARVARRGTQRCKCSDEQIQRYLDRPRAFLSALDFETVSVG